jgi:hypothetical protein
MSFSLDRDFDASSCIVSHLSILRFSAAQVLYPPVILVSIALGSAAIISSIAFLELKKFKRHRIPG